MYTQDFDEVLVPAHINGVMAAPVRGTWMSLLNPYMKDVTGLGQGANGGTIIVCPSSSYGVPTDYAVNAQSLASSSPAVTAPIQVQLHLLTPSLLSTALPVCFLRATPKYHVPAWGVGYQSAG